MKKIKNFKKNRIYSIFYHIISQCNDNCAFCMERGNIRSGYPIMTIQEIKNNYSHIKKKYNVDYILLGGGEPAIHPQFFEIVDFFHQQGIGLHILTNLLRFTDKGFLKRLSNYFLKFKNEKQKKFSLITASIHNLPDASLKSTIRIRGLIQALKCQFPTRITTVAHRDNIRNLPKLANLLKDIFSKYAPDKLLHWEVRLPCLQRTKKEILRENLPTNFPQLKKAIEKIVSLSDVPSTKLTLWDFPLCYIENFSKLKDYNFGENYHFVIDKENQLSKTPLNKIIISDEHKDCGSLFKLYGECRKCYLQKKCHKIHIDYIRKYNFPYPKSTRDKDFYN